MEAKITSKEIEMIMEGLDLLSTREREKSASITLFGSLLGGMTSDPEAKDIIKDEVKKAQDGAEEKDMEMSEKVVLLKAKLIGIKNAIKMNESINWS